MYSCPTNTWFSKAQLHRRSLLATLPNSIWKRRSPCSSTCCPAEALWAVTNDHDDVAVDTGDVAASAAGAGLDLEAKEPM